MSQKPDEREGLVNLLTEQINLCARLVGQLAHDKTVEEYLYRIQRLKRVLAEVEAEAAARERRGSQAC